MISSRTTIHDVWEALRVPYEGDDVVKEQQVQAYQSKFKDLKRLGKEPLNYLYLRLSTIINQAV